MHLFDLERLSWYNPGSLHRHEPDQRQEESP